MKLRSALLLALAIPLAAGEPLTLQQATDLALSGNPRLQAAKLDAVAARQRTQQSVARRLGELDLVGQYSHFNQNQILVPMTSELLPISAVPFDRNQRHYGVTWSIPLLAGGSLREGDAIARLGQEAAERQAGFTRSELRYDVRAAYRNVLALRHAAEAEEVLVRALETDAAQARQRVAVGRWAEVDDAKVEYALQDARAQASALEARADYAQALLAALMGQDPPRRPFVLEEPANLPDPGPGDAELLQDRAAAGREDLQAVRAGTGAAERRRSLARWSFGPQLALSGSYLKNEAPSTAGSFDTHDLTVALKIPLFDGGRRLHAVSEANASLAAARERVRSKELEVRTQVADALGRLREARARYQSGLAQRRLGQEVARVEQVKLEQGRGRVEDYLVARAQEAGGETAYWQGLYGLQSAADYLDFAIGKGAEHD